MCVHSTVMRQATGGSERLVVHLYSDLNTTAFHALPNDDVPLREEVVPIRDIRVTFAPEYRLGRVYTLICIASLEGATNLLLSLSYTFNFGLFTHCGLAAYITFSSEW